MGERRCKDCATEGVATNRPAPHVGPRCVSHHRARKKATSAKAHGKRIESIYGITSEEYVAILDFQGGRCAICQRATGRARRLAVDHDHSLEGRAAVRGILCGPCNFELIGRHDVEGLQRAIDYLGDPPARKVLKP